MDYGGCQPKSFTNGQIQKMFDDFNEFRLLSIPCQPDETAIDFEMLFDANGSQNHIEYW
jgi:hypothetical protein